MTKEEMKQFHEAMAPALFNASWDLLEKENRTRDDENKLINMVHASLFHWRQIGSAVNLLRGEWMISHVYALLNHPEAALYHAENGLKIALENDIKDFDLAYAYEALARAYACAANKDEFKKYYDLAEKSGKEIAAEGDRNQFNSDMNDKHWFGMK